MSVSFVKRFLNDENGAVTVDWVVLTAGVMMLVIAIAMPIIFSASDRAAQVMSDDIDAAAALGR